MNAAQIDMGFSSPAVKSHTFGEFLGSWSSNSDHCAEIHTEDGRVLVTRVRLNYPEKNSLIAVIDGIERVFEHPGGSWLFRGDPVAEVLSDIALDIPPRLFALFAENARTKFMAGAKGRRKEAREDLRAVNKAVKEKGLEVV